MVPGTARRDEPNCGDDGGTRAPEPVRLRLPYERPRLTPHGTLVDLTQKRSASPGRDNPHFLRSS
jgi:hypothetical protein